MTTRDALTDFATITPEERAEFRAECKAIVARGGENAELAERMLRISERLQELSDRATKFLNS